MNGDLLYRPPKAGGTWVIKRLELIDRSLRITQSNDEVNRPGSSTSAEIVSLDPTCSVFETNLGPHAFEVVTPKKILHFISESKEITAAWILALRQAISTCVLNTEDPFIKAICERINLDKYYEVQFNEESKPLGVVLERSRESAVVKMSNFKVLLNILNLNYLRI